MEAWEWGGGGGAQRVLRARIRSAETLGGSQARGTGGVRAGGFPKALQPIRDSQDAALALWDTEAVLLCRRPFPPAGSELPSGQVDPKGRPVWGAGQCPVLPRVPKKRLASVCSQEVPHLAVLGAVLIMKAQTWSHFHREIYREC